MQIEKSEELKYVLQVYAEETTFGDKQEAHQNLLVKVRQKKQTDYLVQNSRKEGTPRNTTLHHPSTHSVFDTDQKHHKLLHFFTHLDQSRNCLYLLARVRGCGLLILCWSTKEWVVAARGRRWTWGSIAKDRGWPSSSSLTCCCNQARRPVATLCRWEPTAFDASALGRDPRIH